MFQCQILYVTVAAEFAVVAAGAGPAGRATVATRIAATVSNRRARSGMGEIRMGPLLR